MSNPSTVIIINDEGMGTAPDQLQKKLAGTYLSLLNELDQPPAAICFYAEGVKLVTDDSPVLEQLQVLQDKGVHLIVCSTCLHYFGLEDEIKVGIVGGMTDILEAQWRADKVITL